MEARLKGDCDDNECISQNGCYIHKKKDHKQEELKLPEVSEFQEYKLPHIGVVGLVHDGVTSLGPPWEKTGRDKAYRCCEMVALFSMHDCCNKAMSTLQSRSTCLLRTNVPNPCLCVLESLSFCECAK